MAKTTQHQVLLDKLRNNNNNNSDDDDDYNQNKK